MKTSQECLLNSCRGCKDTSCTCQHHTQDDINKAHRQIAGSRLLSNWGKRLNAECRRRTCSPHWFSVEGRDEVGYNDMGQNTTFDPERYAELRAAFDERQRNRSVRRSFWKRWAA